MCCAESLQLCLTLCDPMDCCLPGSSVHGDSPAKNTGVGCQALLQENLPNPWIKPRSPTLQADSLHLSHQVSPYLHIELNNKVYVILEHEEIFFLKEKKKEATSTYTPAYQKK